MVTGRVVGVVPALGERIAVQPPADGDHGAAAVLRDAARPPAGLARDAIALHGFARKTTTLLSSATTLDEIPTGGSTSGISSSYIRRTYNPPLVMPA